MIDFLYLHNHESNTLPNAVHQSNNPLSEKNSDEAFAEDTAREEEERVEDSVADANQVDGGIDPTDSCAAAALSLQWMAHWERAFSQCIARCMCWA